MLSAEVEFLLGDLPTHHDFLKRSTFPFKLWYYRVVQDDQYISTVPGNQSIYGLMEGGI